MSAWHFFAAVAASFFTGAIWGCIATVEITRKLHASGKMPKSLTEGRK